MAGKLVARNAIVNFKYITSWKAIARYFLAIVNRRISISHKFVNIYKNTYYLVALKTSTMFNHLPNIFTSLYLINSYIYIFIFLIKSLFLLFRRLNVPLCVCVCVCLRWKLHNGDTTNLETIVSFLRHKCQDLIFARDPSI